MAGWLQSGHAKLPADSRRAELAEPDGAKAKEDGQNDVGGRPQPIAHYADLVGKPALAPPAMKPKIAKVG